MRPDDVPELLEIDRAAVELPETARFEPVLTTEPFAAEFDEPERLDPGRAQIEAWESRPLRRRPGLVIGVLGSLGLHLMPLLALVHWNSAPDAIAMPIPVQLVLEEPPPPPPAPPSPEEKPLVPGRLASEDMGEPATEPPQAAAAPPSETQIAAAIPPPKPAPPAETQIAAAIPRPRPMPPPKPAEPAGIWHRLDAAPHAARLEPRAPGPAAARDEYLAYLVSLTRRHLDLLPMSMIAGRSGETILEVLVLGDGTIARVGVTHGSGYPEIDARVEKMVIAVGRFPPLPQWYQGPSMELSFRLRFPYPEE